MSSISPISSRPPVAPTTPVANDRDDSAKTTEKKAAPAPAPQADSVQASKAPGTGTVVDIKA